MAPIQLNEEREWDRESMFQYLEEQYGDIEKSVAQRIVQWARDSNYTIEGGKKTERGTLMIKWDPDEMPALYLIKANGTLQVSYGGFENKLPAKSNGIIDEFFEKFRDLFGVRFNSFERKSSLVIPLDDFGGDDNMKRFFEIHDWFLNQLQLSNGAASD